MLIPESNQPVAEKVSQLIESKGLKKKAVAEKAGYSEQILSDMLNGRRIIRVMDMIRIMEVLGVDANTLFGIVGKKEGEMITINGSEFKEIQIITNENELIASITDEDVIEKDGYKVVCVPVSD